MIAKRDAAQPVLLLKIKGNNELSSIIPYLLRPAKFKASGKVNLFSYNALPMIQA